MDSYSYDYSASSSLFGGMFIVMGIIWLIVAIILIAAFWKIFVKAGKPGWAAIIPFYNIYILLDIVGRPAWWIAVYIGAAILGWIPILGWLIMIGVIVMQFIVCIDLAKAFGKDTGYGIGLALLSIVFAPMLGFGSAQYLGKPNNPTM